MSWLCVSGQDTSGSWILWLGSSEIDGDLIDWFQLRRTAQTFSPDPRCHRLTTPDRPEMYPSPLHLGMTLRQTKQALGEPRWSTRSYFVFERDRSLKLRGQPYTETSSVNAELNKDRVVAIEVNKVTSN